MSESSADSVRHLKPGMPALNIDTAMGGFTIALYEQHAPETCRYFLDMVQRGRLSGCTIFRITAEENSEPDDSHPIHVIQLGTDKGLDEDRHSIHHESTDQTGLRHCRWTVSASRFGPGEVYGSFFVCMRDEPSLDKGGSRHADGLGYAAFGDVVAGSSTLNKIYAEAQPRELLDTPIPVDNVMLMRLPRDICLELERP